MIDYQRLSSLIIYIAIENIFEYSMQLFHSLQLVVYCNLYDVK
ncbi:Uncharacterized protein BM_BM14258 [Brugia malayi]|uniref:Bm14258 n=1 Tax=Brugia malayi TaxID=6279 RepID=A0A0J9XZX5_BRUMA|nr:Uncharacterized protein BM_BM14258 [Brugia malayi]CDP99328.1 Bm14258 [Brugia malayi]VIO90802.1 Uncharacterized protein BM_BM14258 [Brugia malayi]